jgi:hypothetical protein
MEADEYNASMRALEKPELAGNGPRDALDI